MPTVGLGEVELSRQFGDLKRALHASDHHVILGWSGKEY